MRDARAAMAGTDPNAPHRPDKLITDVRDLGGPRKRQFRPGCDGSPPDHLAIVVGEDARRDPAAAEPLYVLPACPADECAVGFRVEAVAQAPAHRGIRVLGSDHDRDILEPCQSRGADLDAHGYMARVVRRRNGRATPVGSAASRPAP